MKQISPGGAIDQQQHPGLLGAQDPDPVITINADGPSPFLLTGDHAGNLIPRSLGTLGLPMQDRVRHIAWDIGVMDLGLRLSASLDAPFIAQRYSRLVIDCNRDPLTPEAMPVASDGSSIPGNEDLNGTARAARIDAIHSPYHAAITRHIASRAAQDRPTILIALHSFAPVMADISRPWHVGIMHWKGRTGFARALLQALAQDGRFVIGDNAPYRMDSTDYSIPLHAFGANLPYAEIEIRQDLVGDDQGCAIWNHILSRKLVEAATMPGF